MSEAELLKALHQHLRAELITVRAGLLINEKKKMVGINHSRFYRENGINYVESVVQNKRQTNPSQKQVVLFLAAVDVGSPPASFHSYACLAMPFRAELGQDSGFLRSLS